MLLGYNYTPSFPMPGYKVMPSLLPLQSCYLEEEESASMDEEMDVVPEGSKVACPMDLSTSRVGNFDKKMYYRTGSTDSLITNGSFDDNDLDGSDVDYMYQGHRPRLPTADMILMLNKHKRQQTFKMPVNEGVLPLNLSTKKDIRRKSSAEERCKPQSISDQSEDVEVIDMDGGETSNSNDMDVGAADSPNAATHKAETNCHKVDDHLSNHNRFDWADYRRSMSCSQIDFRFQQKLAANKLKHRLGSSNKYRSSAILSSGDSVASHSDMSHDRDDGFHDESDANMSSSKCSSDARNSPVKSSPNNRIGVGGNGASSSTARQDTSHLLMSEPPEAFVHTLEQLSFGGQVQNTQSAAFLRSLTDQYVPPQYMNPLNSFPVDAYGYYAHLMQRLQAHHVIDQNEGVSSGSHHSSPNLSGSPTQLDDQSSDVSQIFGGMAGKKRPPRALTGRHVREGTGASPSTLISLRKTIEERQRHKKVDFPERRFISKSKSSKASSSRPRAYSATLSARTVVEDAESDTISIASE